MSAIGRLTRGLRFAVAGTVIGVAAHAAPYPAGPIRIVVPFAPGAGTDAIARLVAPELSKVLSTPVIVENKPGAGGNLGTESVVRSRPDGQTLLLSGHWVAVNRHLFKEMKFDPLHDLASVDLIARQPLVLVVNPDVKATTLSELTRLAKTTPEALSYGSAGVGSPPQLIAELYKKTTSTQILHVPFKGSAPALTAIIGGQVSLMFLGPSSTVQHIKSGRLRALAVTGTVRSPLLPDVPTFAEAGLKVPAFDNGSWWGISAPSGTPKDVVSVLNGALNTILRDPKFREQLTAVGYEPLGSTPEQYERLVRTESDTWAKVIKDAGLVGEQ